MNSPKRKFFGMTPRALVASVALGIALMFLVSIWIGLLAVLIVAAVINYRNYRESRPEAAYEVTANGTRQLWNDYQKIFESQKFDETTAKVHETSLPAQFTIIRGGVEGTRKAYLEEVYEFLDACDLTPESAEWEGALAGVPIYIDGEFILFIRCSDADDAMPRIRAGRRGKGMGIIPYPGD